MVTQAEVETYVAPPAAQKIRVSGDKVEFLGAQGIVGMRRREADLELDIAMVNPSPNRALQEAMDSAQIQLVGNIAKALKSSMQRVGQSFTGHMVMNYAVFAVGLVAFVLAAVKGLDNPGKSDAIVTAAFGGLSAAAFIAYFISRPIAAVASAGPEAAWILSAVNTYWTKLIYLNNPATFVRDIEHAQKDFEESMVLFFEKRDFESRAKVIKDPNPPAKAPAKKAAAKKAPAKKAPAKKATGKKAAAKRTPAKKTTSATRPVMANGVPSGRAAR
jgi:hypothetical protein